MTQIRFIPIPTGDADALRAGGKDANGGAPERRVSDGDGVPCRHCLAHVPAGKPFLVAAYRPFAGRGPFSEVGPIFVCADACAVPAAGDGGAVPAMLDGPRYMIRAYDGDEAIIYGTGAIVLRADLTAAVAALIERPRAAFVHVRSAANGCFQCRVERG